MKGSCADGIYLYNIGIPERFTVLSLFLSFFCHCNDNFICQSEWQISLKLRKNLFDESVIYIFTSIFFEIHHLFLLLLLISLCFSIANVCQYRNNWYTCRFLHWHWWLVYCYSMCLCLRLFFFYFLYSK